MTEQNLSRLLVTAQFSLLGYFALFHRIAQPFEFPAWPTLLLVGAGALLALSSWYFLSRDRSFRIAPIPREEGLLTRRGPYRYIRHPMYTSVLLVAFGLVLDYPTPAHLIAFALLFIVLIYKLRFEEELLRKRFPEYKAYAATTKTLFPFLF